MRRWLVVALAAASAVAVALWLARSGTGETAPVIRELASQRESSSGAPSLSRQAIPPTDLPPPGTRSLFDHLLKESGGLPFPFEKLLDLVASYDADGKRPVAVLIPDGRSLLKAQASFAKPRIVVAADVHPVESEGDLGFLFRGRLFLGYVEDAREIEVLSYNEQAGRFEFQLVRDYAAGEVPVITYARRSLCTTCHQNEAPIFPERPWDETNARPEIAARILDARRVAVAERSSARYFGVPIVTTLGSAEAVDDLVNVGNLVATAERAWLDGCGGGEPGSACRRQMLAAALAYLWDPGDFSAADPRAAKLLELQRASWPTAGLPVPNPNLPNRDPLADTGESAGLVARVRSMFVRSRPSADEEGVPDSVRSFEKTAPLRPELDPLTPRAPRRLLGSATLESAVAVAGLFGAPDRRLLESASNGDFARLERALDGDSASGLCGARPLRRVETMKTLLTALGLQALPRSSVETDEGMSPPVVYGVEPLRLRPGSPLEPFERYCFGCHRGNPAARLDFMSGATEGEVLDRMRRVERIREVLDWERYAGTSKEGSLMPPRDSYQREALERARAEGKKELEAMLAAVPESLGF